MSAPALTPVPVHPDIEAFVWAQIKRIPGVQSWLYASVYEWPGWQYRHSLQVDVRSQRRRVARDRAEEVRLIICALSDVDWPEGVVTYCQPTEGPFYDPDDDGTPRFVARYEVRVHPRASFDTGPPVHPPPEPEGTF